MVKSVMVTSVMGTSVMVTSVMGTSVMVTSTMQTSGHANKISIYGYIAT